MTTKEVFVCETCGKGFETPMALLGHVGFHKNSGRYKCELCSLEDGMEVFFSLPQGLGAHMRSKHGVAGTSGKALRKARGAGIKVERFPKPEPVVVDPELIDIHEAPNQNGSGEMSTVIEQAFQPLEAHYRRLQERQAWLAGEQEQVERDLGELWAVLQGRGENLTPPPQHGVQVAFRKTVSDSLA